ncbi:MAG TPA: polymer-forming cytoskeletal protein [Pyrinomonadaceae bacterium]|jgi:cytoskeletal protein CcmA (bactofilin family)|nr:polymer-forming cytoskeletal protein [Pyrinomonadaceae bacterium]
MLRIGKNAKDQEETDHTTHKPEVPDYATAKPYSYQAPSVEARPATEATPAPRGAMTESETLARDIKEGTLSGFVGGGTDVTGEANFKAMMRVDGHFSGRISSSSGTLIVGNNGTVDANIEVAVAVIHGTINGDIIATQRLELGRAAKVHGNIQTPSLVIEQGAIFEGSCKMIQMQSAAEKAKKEKKDEPLDTTKMPTVRADAPVSTPAPAAAKPATIPNVSNVVS